MLDGREPGITASGQSFVQDLEICEEIEVSGLSWASNATQPLHSALLQDGLLNQQ